MFEGVVEFDFGWGIPACRFDLCVNPHDVEMSIVIPLVIIVVTNDFEAQLLLHYPHVVLHLLEIGAGELLLQMLVAQAEPVGLSLQLFPSFVGVCCFYLIFADFVLKLVDDLQQIFIVLLPMLDVPVFLHQVFLHLHVHF